MDMNIEIIGWLGFGILVSAWIPQTLETIKDGFCNANLLFIILYVISSFLLALYAFLQGDAVFLALNGLLTLGSGINLYYKLFPRNKPLS